MLLFPDYVSYEQEKDPYSQLRTGASVERRIWESSFYPAEAATAFPARSRGCGCTARAGSDVSTTQMVWVVGSAQAIVPVDPVWPNVVSEQPLLPADAPTLNPNPRGVSPGGF